MSEHLQSHLHAVCHQHRCPSTMPCEKAVMASTLNEHVPDLADMSKHGQLGKFCSKTHTITANCSTNCFNYYQLNCTDRVNQKVFFGYFLSNPLKLKGTITHLFTFYTYNCQVATDCLETF